MLRLAIVRVNEATGAKKILLEHDLADLLVEEAHNSRPWGFRKRHAKRVAAHLAAAEARVRMRTVYLP
jgi:hypothetical protein